MNILARFCLNMPEDTMARTRRHAETPMEPELCDHGVHLYDYCEDCAEECALEDDRKDDE